MRRLIFPLILGLGGCAILIALGVWQIERLKWKEALIAEIDARIASEPKSAGLPVDVDRVADQYRTVVLSGMTGPDLLVLSGKKGVGPGYEVITAFTADDGRRVLVDRGFVAEDQHRAPRPTARLTITGNLLWPDDADRYTPEPDRAKRLWFSRDIPTMAEFLQTEPILVVARSAAGQHAEITTVPVTSEAIPNDHLEYALTWFALAGVWAGMTGYLLWRIRKRTV